MSFALITGASKGIGKAIALEFAKRKKDVILVARNGEALEKLSLQLRDDYGIQAFHLSLDLTSPNASQELFTWVKEKGLLVNTLVNNAGYGLSGPFDSHSLQDHQNMIQLNINVLVNLTYIFLPMLKGQRKSYILNVASSAAYQAVPFLSAYAASKSFVLQFSRGLSIELKGTSVTVTCVSPGATDTEFVDRAKIGEKGRKMAKKVHMTPESVAAIGVEAMYAGKTEVITGILNKLGAALAWLLPKKIIENTSSKIYQ